MKLLELAERLEGHAATVLTAVADLLDEEGTTPFDAINGAESLLKCAAALRARAAQESAS